MATTRQKQMIITRTCSITDDSHRQQAIDDEIKTQEIFIDDDYLFDSGDEQETKNFVTLYLATLITRTFYLEM